MNYKATGLIHLQFLPINFDGSQNTKDTSLKWSHHDHLCPLHSSEQRSQDSDPQTLPNACAESLYECCSRQRGSGGVVAAAAGCVGAFLASTMRLTSLHAWFWFRLAIKQLPFKFVSALITSAGSCSVSSYYCRNKILDWSPFVNCTMIFVGIFHCFLRSVCELLKFSVCGGGVTHTRGHRHLFLSLHYSR